MFLAVYSCFLPCGTHHHPPQIKNALQWLPEHEVTDEAYVRVQRKGGKDSQLRCVEREVVVSATLTMIMPETRPHWAGLGKWAVRFPKLRCIYLSSCVTPVRCLFVELRVNTGL